MPAAGSSSMTASAPPSSTRPSSSSFFWPPERSIARVVADDEKIEVGARPRSRAGAAPPRASRAFRVRSTAAQKLSPGWCLPYSIRFSITVSGRGRARSGRCERGPRAASRSGRQPVTSVPANVTRPASAACAPVTALNSVVLPAPFGPISPVIRPCSTARSRRRAR